MHRWGGMSLQHLVKKNHSDYFFCFNLWVFLFLRIFISHGKKSSLMLQIIWCTISNWKALLWQSHLFLSSFFFYMSFSITHTQLLPLPGFHILTQPPIKSIEMLSISLCVRKVSGCLCAFICEGWSFKYKNRFDFRFEAQASSGLKEGYYSAASSPLWSALWQDCMQS